MFKQLQWLSSLPIIPKAACGMFGAGGSDVLCTCNLFCFSQKKKKKDFVSKGDIILRQMQSIPDCFHGVGVEIYKIKMKKS